MAKEKEELNRLTIALPAAVEEKIRDVSLILGIKNSELIARAIEKYVEAVEKQVGPEFTKALEGIKAVRKIQDGA